MTIEEFLDAWNQKGHIATANIGIAESFFRRELPNLDASPEGYARAFDALNKPITWKTLHDYDRRLMTDVIETTGLYAAAAGKALCRTQRPAMSDWKTNTKKAIAPLSYLDAMQGIMHAALLSALPAEQKLTLCRYAHPEIWLTSVYFSDLAALLPVNENQRLALMPWSEVGPSYVHKKLAQRLCPKNFPLLDSMLSDEQWGSRSELMALSAQFTTKRLPRESFTLPAEFEA